MSADRRINNAVLLGSEVNAWQASRNAIDSQINWQFTTNDARVKLRRLYPEYLGKTSRSRRRCQRRFIISNLNMDGPLASGHQ